jgi:hypothetical protein
MATYKIVIPEPCTVGRENMTDTVNGSYCHSCKKEVIDFSNKTNGEIADIIRKNTGGMCGRIYPKQMEQQYHIPLETPYSRGFNKGFIGAALSLLVAFFYVKADAKEVKQGVEMVSKINNENTFPDVIDEPVDSNYIIIKGKVVNRNSQPISGVVVTLQQYSNIRFVTKADGLFELKVHKKIYNENTGIYFSVAGYEPGLYSVKAAKQMHNVIMLYDYRDIQVDGGMMFIPVEGE